MLRGAVPWLRRRRRRRLLEMQRLVYGLILEVNRHVFAIAEARRYTAARSEYMQPAQALPLLRQLALLLALLPPVVRLRVVIQLDDLALVLARLGCMRAMTSSTLLA